MLEMSHRALAESAGADACLFKGVPFEELIETVAGLGFDVSIMPAQRSA